DTDWGGDFGEKDDDNNPVLDTDGAPIVDVYPVVLDKQNPSNAVWRLKSVIHEDVDPLLASLYTDMGYTDSDVIYKADTSSDEVTGQMSLLYFAAKYLFDGTGTEDGQLKALAIKLGDKLVKHIVTNGFRFVDAHGNATKWARWYASYFAESIDPTLNVNGNPPGEYTGGYEDATLNAAEIMSFVKVAAYLTSLDAAYSEDHALFQGVYEDMWGEWKGIYDDSENGKGYIHVMEEYIKRKKEVISSDFDDYQDINSIIHASGDWTLVVNYSDENLFAMSFLPLIDIEMQENPNSDRVAALRGVLEQWWTNMKRENNPFYTFLYQYANPQKTDVDLSSAAWMLERMPQYRINFPVNNSSRKDLFLIDYFNYRDKGSKSVNRALPFDESLNIKFNSNPFTAHTGTNDKVNPTAYNNVDYSSGSIQSGTWFTLPYWMGRYYGMLQGE
ncbi:hypothetical protein K0U00_14485, partial [Paenibacillus sepulcri]|nr:hypothetical protein [Paenibacillus sepulcri]